VVPLVWSLVLSVSSCKNKFFIPQLHFPRLVFN
jgi:hypothetical protein